MMRRTIIPAVVAMLITAVSSSLGLVFKKSEAGGYDYRERRVIAFIGRTSHTNIDLVAECDRVGGCEVRR